MGNRNFARSSSRPVSGARTRLSLHALAVPALSLLVLSCLQSQAQNALTSLHRDFANPPTDARPMVRWWWFGPAVQAQELTRELDAMHSVGIGGVELAAEYPLALDDPAKNILNLRYGSPEYLAMLTAASEHARSLGMRVDLTLGSGWPFGGPEISTDLAAGKLRIVVVPLPSPSSSLPRLAAGESFIAAFVAEGTPKHYAAATARRLAADTMPSSLAEPAPIAAGPSVELFFIASHTDQQVKRAAFGAEGPVLDHMARAAVEQHLHVVGDKLLSAFPNDPPYAIFSDSLEVYDSDWTPGLPAFFHSHRGYDLIAHLPELAQGGTPEADAVRHDWGVTLSEMVSENYLRTVADYATQHGTRFRSQTYGSPAVTLSDEAIPQLPEGEGPQWRSFSFTRWASSANHVYSNNVTSAETFTWLHSPAFRATPLDMKAEADRMFLEGVNQIVCHGYPYSAPGVPEPGWSLYAAAALNDHNPWWPVMPDVMSYLTRMSWLLRQGAPANDVAILLPEDDAQAAFRPGHVSVTDELGRRITPPLMSTILDTGYNIDYIDLAAIHQRGLHYPIVVVPPTQRMPLSGVHALEDYVHSGGKLIFLGATPTLAAGRNDARDSAAVTSGIAHLLATSTHVASISDLPAALTHSLAPDVVPATAAGDLGFLHRHLPTADIYFLANTSSKPIPWSVHVRASRAVAEWWDPETGASTLATPGESITLPPYGSRVLVLRDAVPGEKLPASAPILAASNKPEVLLSKWTLSFPGSAGSAAQPTQHETTATLWTDTTSTRFYSGEVHYTAHFHAAQLSPGEHLSLHFAAGTPVPEPQTRRNPHVRAWYDPPIREAAQVFLNGHHIGDLWHPPYVLDVSSALQQGDNTLELRVFNTAINELAGQPPRDYTALNAKYGERFEMQDMKNLQPVPSGIAGPVELVYSNLVQHGNVP